MNEELINSDREKTAQFLSKAQSGALQAGLSPAQREKINQYVIEQRNIYVNNALIAQEFDKSTPAYMEAIQNMNGVRNNLSNLANQQKSIAENQKQYLDDFSSDRISKANYDPSNPTMLTDVYTGKADMEIGEGGNIYFGDGKTYKPYADIADYSLKAYDTSNDLLDVSNKVYNSKYRLGAGSIQQAKNWVQNVIEKGGRKNLLSLIYDGLIPGVDETQFSKELYRPENYSGLKKAFLDKYGLALDEINNALPTIPTKAVTNKPRYSSGGYSKPMQDIPKEGTFYEKTGMDKESRLAIWNQTKELEGPLNVTKRFKASFTDYNDLAPEYYGGKYQGATWYEIEKGADDNSFILNAYENKSSDKKIDGLTRTISKQQLRDQLGIYDINSDPASLNEKLNR